jgi:tetratricopeptide (TPR) repeat protein
VSRQQARFAKALDLHGAGALDQAARLYRSVLQAEPAHFDAAHMLGVVHLQRGEHELAERQIRRALQISPNVPEACNNLGTALRHLDRLDEALASYDRAIALRARYPEALCHRGNALRLLHRSEEALDSYARAIAARPNYVDAHYNRGAMLEELQQWDDAAACYENVLALQPDFVEAHNNLGNVLQALGRHEEALASYGQAIARRPGYAEALTNRGNVLRRLSRLDEALADHNAALALRPGFAEAFNNRGSAWHDLGRFDDAIADFRQVFARNPMHFEARANLALAQLLLGHWEQGWDGYEFRFHKKQNATFRPDHPASEWSGEPLDGRRILLFAEQGFGDAIQFVRYVPALQAMGAHVTVMAHRRLHRLLATAGEGIEFVAAAMPEMRFDYQAPLMSLPRLLNVRVDTVAAPQSYLHADPARSETWRARLGSHGFKAGLAWQGNPAGSVDHGRSIPLREFAPLSQIGRVRLISLQKNHGAEQLDKRPAGMAVETPGHDFDGGADAFVDTAAMMMNLDLVVTSDTSIAHLAGALGRPVWVALKSVPDWRWLLGREDSPWYPSMRLFRQSRIGDWSGPVAAMARELRGLAHNAGGNGDIHSAA